MRKKGAWATIPMAAVEWRVCSRKFRIGRKPASCYDVRSKVRRGRRSGRRSQRRVHFPQSGLQESQTGSRRCKPLHNNG